MTTKTDRELLQAYTLAGSDSAFSELVSRHIHFVYSTALRIIVDAHLAEDVTQATFLALAQNAKALAGREVLSGWLHVTTRNVAAKTVRTEERCRSREREAAAMLTTPSTPDHTWDHLAPLLDEALSRLKLADRDAVMLRFFETQSAIQMAERLHLSPEAAQKRVTRAIEQLRHILSKRGLTVSAAALSASISLNALQAAPAAFAMATCNMTLPVTAAAGISTVGFIKGLLMTKITTATVSIAALAIAVAIYEARQSGDWRIQAQISEQKQVALSEQLQQIGQKQEEASVQIADLEKDNQRLKRNDLELQRLRGEVTRLRQAARSSSTGNSTDDAIKSQAEQWLSNVNLLKQRLREHPEASIPELKLLNDSDWLTAAARRELKTDTDFRQALGRLRMIAESHFAEHAYVALKNYQVANNGAFPTDVNQLQPFYFGSVDPAILERWEIVAREQDGVPIITQKSPVDADFDSREWISSNGPGGQGMGSFRIPEVKEVTANTNIVKNPAIDPRDALIVGPALKAFSLANGGQQATSADQLTPYLTSADQSAALLRLSGEMGGVGVALSAGPGSGLPKIDRVLTASSAEKAGVEPGSVLLSINGTNTTGMSMVEWTGMIRGRAGTSVTLELADPAMTRTNTITMTRAKM